MVESVGTKLHRARLAKKISVEYAARATRIRPDRIVDLEKDDYTNFPNLAYAKSFLIIYAKYLAVDISEFASAFETGNPVTIADYGYLSNPPLRQRSYRSSGGYGGFESDSRPQGPSLGTVLVALLILGFLGILGVYLYQTAQRIGIGTTPASDAIVAPTPLQAAPVSSAVPPSTPAPPPTPELAPTPAEPSPTPTEAAAPSETPPPISTELPVFRAQPVLPGETPVPETAGIPLPTPSQVEVTAKRKTWVTVRQGGREGTPIFDDYIYPSTRPLQFKGNDFYIELREPAEAEIRKNGAPVPYATPGVTIE